MIINADDLKQLDKRYRAQLINSLSGIKSANLVGTINKAGETNLSIVSSVFHLGAHPALMGMIFEPAVVERHTFENILETKHFTLNHVNADIFMKAHQTSARYPREVSEFKAVGLTEEFQNKFIAPFVKESIIKMSLELKETQHLSINKTEMVIAEIIYIDFPDEIVQKDGYLDILKAGTIGVSGLDHYVEASSLALEVCKARSVAMPIRQLVF